MGINDSKTDGTVQSEINEKITEPPMYKVLLHNDNYTTMEFVFEILIAVFKKSY